jgi:hypothetical protein
MKKPDENGNVVEDTREPYESPRLEVEDLFEVLALACAKTPGRAQCTGRGNSPRAS